MVSPEALATRLHEEQHLEDVLCALTRILWGRDGAPSASYSDICAAYDLVEGLSWDEQIGEHHRLLAEIAFLAWNHARRERSYAEMQRWEQDVVAHTAAQPHVRDFLTLELTSAPDALRCRFLTDPTIMLTSWQVLDQEANFRAPFVARNAIVLFGVLNEISPTAGADAETLVYIKGRVALTVAVVLMHLGKRQAWEVWMKRSEDLLGASLRPSRFLALARYVRLGRLHTLRRYSEVDRDIGSLVRELQSEGMTLPALKARFVQATNLKELSRDGEALPALVDVHREAVRGGVHIISSLTASSIAQIHGKHGRDALASCYSGIAARLALRSRCSWVEGYARGTVGELLRDRGAYLHAAFAYRSGALCYEAEGMMPLAAYMRILTAEAFLLAGRADEAISEVFVALPVIEREDLPEEASVSIGLLKAAIEMQGISPGLLRELRDRIHAIREEESC
jgi:hypothetical protein